MSLEFSAAVRNARLDAIEAAVGAGAVLKIRTGTAPANVATSDSGTVLASITLPADWMAGAANGTKAKSGTWQGASIASGIAGHFRIYASDGVTPHMQGTVTATGGGGDLTLDNVNVAANQQVTVYSFSLTDANAGTPAVDQFDYYVASNGSDSNAGTLASPWQTLSKVNASLAAGKSVALRRGDIFRGPTLTVPGAGVTYGSYGTGAKPIVSGANVLSGAWTADSASGTIADLNSPAGADDGYFGQSGTGFDSAQTDLRTGDMDGVDQSVFLRFVLAVDKGATIDSATLDLVASGTQTGTVTLQIQAVAADDAAAPTTAAGGQALSLTTASVTWNVPNTTGGTVYTTPDFKTVLQEIVNRAGWVNGNEVVIILRTTSAATWTIRDFRSRDHGTASLRPKLDVTYTAGSSTVWYKGSITDDPVVLVHNGAIGDGATVGRSPRKLSKASLAVNWDYYYDDAADRLYVKHSSEPSSTGEVIEYGVRARCIDYHGYDNVTVKDIQFQHNRGDIVLGSYKAAGNAVAAFNVTGCDFKEIAGYALQWNYGEGDFTGNTVMDWGLRGGYDYAVQSIAGTGLDQGIGNKVNGNTFRQTTDRGDVDMMAVNCDLHGWISEVRNNTMILNGLCADEGILIWRPSANASSVLIEGNSITGAGGQAVSLQELTNFATTINVTVRKNILLDSCQRNDLDREGVRLRNYGAGATVKVHYNVIAGTFDGSWTHETIGIEQATGTTQIWNNVIAGGDEGVKIKGASTTSGVSLKNNIIFGNRGAATVDGNHAFAVNNYNCVFGNGSVGETQGANSIASDPLFTDAANDVYTLQAGSPCLNAGDNVGLTEDLLGTAVPQGAAPDMGAYERV